MQNWYNDVATHGILAMATQALMEQGFVWAIYVAVIVLVVIHTRRFLKAKKGA